MTSGVAVTSSRVVVARLSRGAGGVAAWRRRAGLRVCEQRGCVWRACVAACGVRAATGVGPCVRAPRASRLLGAGWERALRVSCLRGCGTEEG